MYLLVSGHRGSIGTVMIPMFFRAGHKDVSLDSDLFRQWTFAPRTQDVPELRVDLRDIQQSELEGLDAIIHLTALSSDPLGDLNPGITYEIMREECEGPLFKRNDHLKHLLASGLVDSTPRWAA
jgi:nucleoside-diphosphate-sugar epimerase